MHFPNCKEETCIARPAGAEFNRRYGKWFHGNLDHHDGLVSSQAELTEAQYNKWRGHHYGLFREPSARVMSAYRYFRGASGTPENYARAASGSMTLQLTGQQHGLVCLLHLGPRCHKKPNMTLALRRLDSFAFVGLSDAYALSICLFHRQFRTPCLPFELYNSRPTTYNETELTAFRAQLARGVPFGGCVDAADETLYAHARSRFARALRDYNVTPHVCAKVCWGTPSDAFKLPPPMLVRPLSVAPCSA